MGTDAKKRAVKQIHRLGEGKFVGKVFVSPDGRQLAFVEFDLKTRSYAVKVMPAGGGQAREVLKVEQREHFKPGAARRSGSLSHGGTGIGGSAGVAERWDGRLSLRRRGWQFCALQYCQAFRATLGSKTFALTKILLPQRLGSRRPARFDGPLPA